MPFIRSLSWLPYAGLIKKRDQSDLSVEQIAFHIWNPSQFIIVVKRRFAIKALPVKTSQVITATDCCHLVKFRLAANFCSTGSDSNRKIIEQGQVKTEES